MTKIEWTHLPGHAKGKTLNVISGCYGPGGTPENPRHCPYCYAERMARRQAGRNGYPKPPEHFVPTFHSDKLRYPAKWKKPRGIFVGSMGDMFGPWIPDEWNGCVFEMVREHVRHTFIFLTKWPDRLARWNPWPVNAWVGASATNYHKLKAAISQLEGVDAVVKFISAEPWLAEPFVSYGWSTGTAAIEGRIDWLVVGQQTGPGISLASPETRQSIKQLLKAARGVPVFMKPPLADSWQNAPKEFPAILEKI